MAVSQGVPATVMDSARMAPGGANAATAAGGDAHALPAPHDREGLRQVLRAAVEEIGPLFEAVTPETRALRRILATPDGSALPKAVSDYHAWLDGLAHSDWRDGARVALIELAGRADVPDDPGPEREAAAVEAGELASALRASRRALQATGQTGDAVAQRLEHAIAALDIASGLPDEAMRLAADRITAMQVSGAATALDEAADQMAGALADLGDGLDRAGEIAASSLGEDRALPVALDPDAAPGLSDADVAEGRAVAAALFHEREMAGSALAAEFDPAGLPEARARAQALAAIRDRLRALASRLDAVATAAACLWQGCEDRLPSPDTDLAWLEAHYTMDAERQIHRAALEAWARAGEEARTPCGDDPEAAAEAVTDPGTLGARVRRLVACAVSAAEDAGASPGATLLPKLTALLVGAAGFTLAILATAAALGTVTPAGALAGGVVTLGALCVLVTFVRRMVRHALAEMEAARREMEDMVLRDALTGCYNRRGLQAHMAKTLKPGSRQASTPLAVFHIDLDHFKSVNDTLGHDAGDHVLLVAAERMREAAGPQAVVSRLGGDEFCILLEGVGEQGRAGDLAEALIRAAREPIPWEGQTCQIGASIGIAFGGGEAGPHDAESLLTNADMAALLSKAGGRGRYSFFDGGLRAEMEAETRLVKRLRTALDEDRVEVWFQPVMSADGARLLSAEALARWHDPEDGAIAPDRFFAIAEKHNLLDPLHQTVLDKALGAMADWQRRGLGLPALTINLSETEVKMHGLVDRLRFLLDREDIDPRRLAVEVAETTATCRGAELAVAALGELRSLGLGVIVDHFGRDQAALANLARLGATAVKIDRGVVAQLGQSADSTTLLSGLATLAHSMKLQVVAKGVESRDQLSILEGIDCEGLQGVAVARPMPAESFAEWMVFNAPEANGSDMAADRETVADPRLSA